MELALAGLEGGVLLWIQEVVRCGLLDALLAFYTQLGNSGLLWIVLCLALLLHPRTRRAGAAGLMALLFSYLFTNLIIKHLVGRTRPWLLVEGLVPLVVEGDPNAFPSGHTSAAFAAAAAWAKTLPHRWMRVTGLVMAALMGLSRLYVGVHFPTDVLCGAVVGTLCGLLGWMTLQKIEERRKGNGLT